MASKYQNSAHLQLLASLGKEICITDPETNHRNALVQVFEAHTLRNKWYTMFRFLGGTFADSRLFREDRIFNVLEQAYLNYNVRPLNALCDEFHANTLVPLVPLIEAHPNQTQRVSLVRMIQTKNRMFRFAVLTEVFTHYLSKSGYPLSASDLNYNRLDQSHRVSIQALPILFHQTMITNVKYRSDREPMMVDLGLQAPHNQ